MGSFRHPLFYFKEDTAIFKEHIINDKIRATEVRLIGEAGEQLGIVSLASAKEIAAKDSLDLVLLNPNGQPAVCKIMDYGKFRFDSIKKEKEARKAQKIVELKEIQLSMTIDENDLKVKAKHGNRFLEEGNKVKVVLRMRGRQQAFAKNAVEVVNKFFAMLEENGTIDKVPEIAGRNVILIVNPKKQL